MSLLNDGDISALSSNKALKYINALSSMVDGCLCVVQCADDIISLKAAKPDFYKLFSCTEETFPSRTKENLLYMVAKTDRDTLLMKIRAQAMFGCDIEQNVFATLNSNDGIWVHCSARAIESENGIYICSLHDLTQERKTNDNFLYEKERNRILIEQTESIIFEYDYMLDTLYTSEKWEKTFGYKLPQEIVAKKIYHADDIIHPDDKAMLLELMSGKNRNSGHFETREIRFFKRDRNYLWTNVAVVVLLDDNGKRKRAIGKITNINDQVEKTLKLKARAHRDPMTELYNSVSVRKLVEQAIFASAPDSLHAMVVIDIDEFKRINDLYGHLSGDKSLIKLARILQEVTTEDDYVGRVGGDEFVFFLRNISGLKSVTDLLNQIYGIIKNSAEVSTEVPSFTCSMGVSLFPRDGCDYSKLFETADTALYSAKLKGKNRYEIYSDTSIATLYQSRIEEFSSIGSEKIRKPMKYTIVQGILDILCHSSNPSEAIVTSLGLAASYYNLSRAVVYRYKPENRKLFDCIYEWVSNEKNSLAENYREAAGVEQYKISKEFGTDGVFICSDMKKYKKLGGIFDFFLKREVTAAIHCGIYDYDSLLGSIGFEAMNGIHEFNMEEIRTLRIVSGIIGMYIMKYDIEKHGSI